MFQYLNPGGFGDIKVLKQADFCEFLRCVRSVNNAPKDTPVYFEETSTKETDGIDVLATVS